MMGLYRKAAPKDVTPSANACVTKPLNSNACVTAIKALTGAERAKRYRMRHADAYRLRNRDRMRAIYAAAKAAR